MCNDESGCLLTWDRTLIACVAAVVIVAAIAVVSYMTCGTATPVLVGALVGLTSSFGMSCLSQYSTTGEINFNTAFVECAIGMVSGAFAGSALGTMDMAISNGLTEGIGSIAIDVVNGYEIDYLSAIMSAGFGAFMGAISKGGAMNGKTQNAKSAKNAVKAFENEPRIKSKTYNKKLSKLKKQLKKEISKLDKTAIKDIFRDLPSDLILDFILIGF